MHSVDARSQYKEGRALDYVFELATIESLVNQKSGFDANASNA